MSVSETMQAILDAFDNSDEGLAIWDQDDILVGFNKKYSKIFRNALYFYSIFPWILTMSFSLTLASIILIFYQTPIDELNFYLFAPQSVYFFLMLSKPGRGLFMGATILMESHIRFLVGQRMHIWDPSSRPPIES